jgi:hypothetical protein
MTPQQEEYYWKSLVAVLERIARSLEKLYALEEDLNDEYESWREDA